MKNSTKGLAPIAIIIGAVIVLIAAGGGYWWWQNKAKVAVPVTSQQATPSQSVTADETAGWKTYTDSQYGFSFKYPASFALSVGTDPNVITLLGQST